MARSYGQEDDHGRPIPFDPDFHGPLKNRSCTDVICLLLFCVFIGCWVGVAAYAIVNGDPNTLLVPKDSHGSRCGLDSHVSDKPYLFFFDLTKCLSPSVTITGCPTQQVCVSKCPTEHFFADTASANEILPKLICEYDVDKPTDPSNTAHIDKAHELIKDGKCARWYVPTKSVQRRCIPSINNINNTSLIPPGITLEDISTASKHIELLAQAEQIGNNIVEDIISSWWKILVGLAFAMLVCIIYIFIMRWVAAVVVWFSIFGVIAILSFCVYVCAKKYIYLKNHPEEHEDAANTFESYLAMKDTWLVFLIIVSVLLGIILLMLIFLRKRIVLAIALIKEGSKAVSSVTSSLFFPIIPWILQIAVITFTIAVALYITTIGSPYYKIKIIQPTDGQETCICTEEAISYTNGTRCDPQIFKKFCRNGMGATCQYTTCHFIKMDNPEYTSYIQAFNIFAFFWMVFFISAFGEMVLASVFATWYWTFHKSNLPFFAVTSATMRTLRYHIGTLAFGSLIIAICRMIRVILEYIDQKLKKYDNEITKAILCCMKCFFWCLENFLKFINKNAYIMCAIHGKNFCVSAKDAFSLLMRNIVRVFVLDKVTDFLFFLSKIFITACVGCVAYVVFVMDVIDLVDAKKLNYNLMPVIIIIICTYFIAALFFSVYSMAVDTLFLCFLEDCERNDGSAEKPYYMSRSLMKILGKKNKIS